jgi:putative redox protein
MSRLRDVIARTAEGPYGQIIEIGPHRLRGDEPVAAGGADTGPAPHELLLAALASCASMTARAYAAKKGLPLRAVDVRVRGHHAEGVYVIERYIALDGDLDDEQRARVLEIAGRCPVARTLSATIRIVSLAEW